MKILYRRESDSSKLGIFLHTSLFSDLYHSNGVLSILKVILCRFFFSFAKAKNIHSYTFLLCWKMACLHQESWRMLLRKVLEELFLSRRKFPGEVEIINLKIIRQRRKNSGSCTSSGLNPAITFSLQKNWAATAILVMFKDQLPLWSVMLDGT